jgi:ribonuclease Z
VLDDPYVRVEAAPLDHKIVSMAYAVIERTHLNVRPGALEGAHLRPGPWLNGLKNAVRSGASDDTPIQVAPGESRPLAALRDGLLDITPGQKIAYVVDTLFSPSNADRVIRLAQDADVFYGATI